MTPHTVYQIHDICLSAAAVSFNCSIIHYTCGSSIYFINLANTTCCFVCHYYGTWQNLSTNI